VPTDDPNLDDPNLLATAVPPEPPAALNPPFQVGDPNRPIILEQGVVHYLRADVAAQAETCISLEWLPSPSIRLTSRDIPYDNIRSMGIFRSIFEGLGEVTLRLNDGTDIPDQALFVERMSNTPKGSLVAWGGQIRARVIRPRPGPVSMVDFLLPNFADPHGRPINYPNGGSAAARSELMGDGWRVTLDEVSEEGQVRSELRAKSGYGVTHVGRIERVDGKTFSVENADEVLNLLAWYFTFVAGRWTGPFLPVGYDANGHRAWEAWDCRRVEPFRFRQSWLQTRDADSFSAPFAGFVARWSDPVWRDVIQTAIHWHTEANKQSGSIEGAIVLTQTAFELLASAVLVETEGWVSQDGFDRLPAEDRIRLLFRWANIPTSIPDVCDQLAALAKAENWSDGPRAMTGVRNTITHPTKKNREKFDRHTDDARVEVWTLGLWALELCLLRLFNYQGRYSCRLRQQHPWEAEIVPWNPPLSTDHAASK
jgi:hypothetical protein